MAEDFNQLFSQTGAGAGGSGSGSGGGDDDKKNRKKALKELTDVFSSKNIFGKEKPAKENTQTAILEQQVALKDFAEQSAPQTDILNSIADIFKSQKQDQAENQFQKEQDDKEKLKILEKDSKVAEETNKASKVQAKEAKSRGSMIGKLGGALAGAGIAAAGLGVALFASANAMKVFQDVDGKKVAENVQEIFALAPKAGGGELLEFFGSKGLLALSLAGLGVGLGVFAIGGAAAGVAQEFAGFDAQNIKEQVLTLLSIGDEFALGDLEFLAKSAGFTAAMIGIGAGLAVFGAGAAVAGAAQGTAEGVAKFTGSGELFAQQIKDNVLILLSIADDVKAKGGSFIGEGLTFYAAMGGIAAGLALFGAGAAVAGAGTGVAEGVARFTGTGELFAQQIKDNVLILLSIKDAVEADGDSFIGETSQFFKAMSGIGAGLAVFGIGSALAGAGSGLANFMSKEGNFAEDIKSKVTTLLSIGEGRDIIQDSDDLKNALKKVGDGIAYFGGKSFSGALANFGASVLEFFTGSKKSPLDIAMEIADKGPELKAGAEGMEELGKAFAVFSRLDLDKDFKISDDAIESLAKFSDGVRLLSGETIVDEGIFFDNVLGDGVDRIAPLQNLAIVFNELADSMARVNDESSNLILPTINSGPELFALGNGGATRNVVINNISNANTSVGPTIASVGINPEGQQTSNSAVSSD